MNIIFQSNQIKSYSAKMAEYDLLSYRKEFIGNTVKYSYLQPNVENYTNMRLMHSEGVISEGYVVLLKLLKADYLANNVPVGITNSVMIDEHLSNDEVSIQENTANKTITGRQKKWSEWQKIIKESNDGLEVIINTNHGYNAIPLPDLDILEKSADVIEFMGQGGFQQKYGNDINWLKDENGDALLEKPLTKTALYFTHNWENECFDFIHAQKQVKAWFDGLKGNTDTKKFNSLDENEKLETIRWGILPRNAECNMLIEAFVPDNNFAASLRIWNMRRGYIARKIRFDTAFYFLIDNTKKDTVSKVNNMLTPKIKEFYLYYGASTSTAHLIVNNKLNPVFWNKFSNQDVAYSNMTLDLIKDKLECILHGDRFITNFI